jgi:hypothetical protein
MPSRDAVLAAEATSHVELVEVGLELALELVGLLGIARRSAPTAARRWPTIWSCTSYIIAPS